MTIWLAPAGRAVELRERLRVQLRTPLLRDGYALVLNSGLTALMGLVYWLLAARTYSTRTVGIDAAAISAMMFLAGVAQLNLMSAILRFIPVSGPRARRLVLSWYALAVGLGAAAGIVFIAGVPLWAPALDALRHPAFALWFVAATMAWCVFNLQDAVLTALGRAVLVPVENQIYSTAKIVLLLAFAGISPHYGIFASWTAALLFSLIPVNLYIFARSMAAHARDDGPHVRPPSRRDVTRFVSADYVASLCWLAATFLMPVIVLAVKGPTVDAWFALAWMIAWPLFGFSANTGAALVVAGSRDEARLGEYLRQARRQTLALVAPLGLLLAAAAPLLLRLFGEGYVNGATDTLRLLGLAAIPNVVVALGVSARRVARRMRAVVGIVATQCGLVLALSLILLPVSGAVGVGFAWLLASSGVAAWVLWADAQGAPSERTPIELARDVAADLRALEALRWVRGALPHRRRARRGEAVARAVLAGTPWTPRRSLRTVTDMAVVMAGPPAGEPSVLVKYATSRAATEGLRAEQRVLAALAADRRIERWRHLLPAVIGHGELGGRPYLVEELFPGEPATLAMSAPATREWLVRHAARAIGQLHRATAAEREVREDDLARWVDEPLKALDGDGRGPSLLPEPAAGTLGTALRAALRGSRIAVSWVHGDFAPGNILASPGGDRIVGIVDWEHARPGGLPPLDVVTLLLATRMHVTRRELGRVVCDWLAGAGWTSFEQWVIDDATLALPGQTLGDDTLVLLAWLHHVSATITKRPAYATHNLWRRSNVDAVARATTEWS